MNNFYELSTQDKDKYRKEFNKIQFTKKINKLRTPALYLTIFGVIATAVLISLVGEGENVQYWANLAETITGMAFLLFVVLDIYLDIIFMRWMKIKHNVEY